MTATTTAAAALTKLKAARLNLMGRLIEREDEIDACLTALVAGEHVLFVGPPGTGKSMLCDAVADLCDGPRFSYLMTKFTDPGEIVGPINLNELKAGRYVRCTAGKLPEAEVAFLDEIFKSSSAILNTMLKILNERVYDAGNGPAAVPLRLCVGASNEWPSSENQQELGALFDRFVIRRVVHPIRGAAGRKALLWGAAPPAAPAAKLTTEELDAARAAAAALPWAADAVEAFEDILRELSREGIIPGDRRQVKAVKVCRAAAWLDGAAEVQKQHLGVLADVLWDAPEEQPKKTAEVVAKIANPTGLQVNGLLVEAEEVIGATNPRELAKVSAAAAKLAEIVKKLKEITGSERATKAATYVMGQVQAMRKAALEASM